MAQDPAWTTPNPNWRPTFGGGNFDETLGRKTETMRYGNMTDSTLSVDSIFQAKLQRNANGFQTVVKGVVLEVVKTLVTSGYEDRVFRIQYKADGTTVHSTTEIDKNPAGVVLMEETKTYENGRVIRGNRIERNAAGTVIKRYRFNKDTNTFEEIAMTECVPKNEVFAGYSNLTPLGEDDAESLALGFHIAYAHFVMQRLALAADFSVHTKKENDLRLMQMFLMGGVQFQLIQAQHRSKMNALARVLAGLAMDRQKFDYGSGTDIQKANAFAIAFGLGLNYELNRRIAIGLLADYIRTRYNDEGQGNLRASLGVRVNLGCK